MVTSVSLVLWIYAAFGITSFLLPEASRFERSALSASLGVFMATWTAFLLFIAFGHGRLLQGILFCLPFFLLAFRFRIKSETARPQPSFPWRFSWKMPAIFLGALCWVFFWLWAARQAVYVTKNGVFTGAAGNYGDLSQHVSYAQYFAWGDRAFRNPVFSGPPLKYHFLNDFLASVFIREGLDIHRVFEAQTFSFGLLMTCLYGIFVKRVTGSAAGGWVGAVLFLASGSFLEVFGAPGLVWQNVLATQLIPQRAFSFGTPVFFLILILLWRAWERGETRLWKWAGVLAGLMPLSSVYCFMSLAFLGSCLSLMKGRRAFLSYALPLGLLALPQVFYIFSTHDSHAPMKWIPGWYESAKNGPLGFLTFWLRNTGLLWPVIFLSLPLLGPKQRLFWVPFFLLFVVGNLVQLTPDMNNNFNLMYLGISGLIPGVTVFLGDLWKFPRAGPVLAAVLFLFLISGGVQKIKTCFTDKGYGIISANDERFSRALREKSRPEDLVLIQPNFNHPVFWSGRCVFSSYAGWVYAMSWGDGAEREAAAKAIYEGGPGAAKDLKDYGIDLVVIGPKERQAYKINQEFLKSAGGLLFDFPDYQVYRIRKPAAA